MSTPEAEIGESIREYTFLSFISFFFTKNITYLTKTSNVTYFPEIHATIDKNRSELSLKDCKEERDELDKSYQKLVYELEEKSDSYFALQAREKELQQIHRQNMEALNQARLKQRDQEEALIDAQQRGIKTSENATAAAKRFEAMKQRCEVAQNEVVSLLAQLRSEQARCSDALTDRENLARELNTSRALEERLKLELQGATGLVGSEKEVAQNTQRQLLQTQTKVSELEEQLSQMRTLFTQLDSTRRQLAQKLTACYVTIDAQRDSELELKRKYSEKEQQIAELKNNTDILKISLNDVDQGRDDLQRELDEKTEELAAACEHQRTSAAREQDAIEQVISLRSQLQSLSTSSGNRERDIVLLERRVQEMERVRQQLTRQIGIKDQENRESQNDLRAMTTENAAVNNECLNQRQQREEMERRLRDTTSQLLQARELCKSLQTDKDDLMVNYRSACDERARLGLAADAFSAEAAELRRNAQDAGLEVNHLRAALDEKKMFAREQQVEVQTYKNRLSSQNRSLMEAEQASVRVQQEMANVASTHASTEAVAHTLSSKSEASQARAIAAEAEAAALRQRVSMMQNESKMMQDQLKNSDKKLRQMEGIVAEARSIQAGIGAGEVSTEIGIDPYVSPVVPKHTPTISAASTKSADQDTTREAFSDGSPMSMPSDIDSIDSAHNLFMNIEDDADRSRASLDAVILENERLRNQLRSTIADTQYETTSKK